MTDRDTALARSASSGAERADGARPGRASSVPRALETGAAWAWRFLVVAAAVTLIAWVAVQLRVVLLPVFVAAIAAALLGPLVDLLDRWMPRLAAAWAVLVSVAAAVAGLALLLTGPIRSATSDFLDNWETARTDIEDWLVDGPLGLSRDQVDDLSARVQDAWSRAGTGLLDSPGSTARTAAEVVGGIFLAIVLAFFFLKDGPRMWSWLLDHLASARREAADRAGKGAFSALQGWIRGVAITGVADATLIGLALVILGVPAALPLAVITFFAAFFPVIGATIAGILATAIALASNGPGTAVIVAIVVLVVQQVEGDVLLPVVMYRQVSLHPVVVLVALAAGGAIGGILGALLAVPLTAMVSGAVAAVRNTDPEGDDASGAVGDSAAAES